MREIFKIEREKFNLCIKIERKKEIKAKKF